MHQRQILVLLTIQSVLAHMNMPIQPRIDITKNHEKRCREIHILPSSGTTTLSLEPILMNNTSKNTRPPIEALIVDKNI